MIILDTNIIHAGATSQYECLPIDSMAQFGNSYLCASSSGLYELTRENDDGDDISGYFKTSLMHFGLTNEKRLRFVYVKYESNAEVTLTVETEYGISEDYCIPASSDVQRVYRVTINRSLYGSYWQFTFSGSSFTIDEISVLPIVRKHKGSY